MNYATAIIFHQDKVLLFHRDDIPTIENPNEWSLPGGVIEEGESPDEAIKRELIEEVSYSPKELHFIGEIREPQTGKNVFVYWSYISDVESEQFKLGEDEEQEIGWFLIDEAKALNLVPSLAWYLNNFGEVVKNLVSKKQTPTAEALGLKTSS